jgi:hypothetical protein
MTFDPRQVRVLHKGIRQHCHYYEYDLDAHTGHAIVCNDGIHSMIEDHLEIYHGKTLLYHSPDLWWLGMLKPYG